MVLRAISKQRKPLNGLASIGKSPTEGLRRSQSVALMSLVNAIQGTFRVLCSFQALLDEISKEYR